MERPIEKLRQLQEDADKKHKDLMIECDMLQGIVNRMMVTNDMRELNDMYEIACKRTTAIYHENFKRLKSEVVDEPIVHAKWVWDENRFIYVCSNCKGNPTEGTGYSHDYSTLASHYHYCRDCGAKMDKE